MIKYHIIDNCLRDHVILLNQKVILSEIKDKRLMN